MTIGPEPMIRMRFRSVRLGISVHCQITLSIGRWATSSTRDQGPTALPLFQVLGIAFVEFCSHLDKDRKTESRVVSVSSKHRGYVRVACRDSVSRFGVSV